MQLRLGRNSHTVSFPCSRQNNLSMSGKCARVSVKQLMRVRIHRKLQLIASHN